jgi:hypothetical protein
MVRTILNIFLCFMCDNGNDNDNENLVFVCLCRLNNLVLVDFVS